MAPQDGQRVGPRQHKRRRGLCEDLLADDDWCSRGGVGTAHGPREENSEGVEASPGPGTHTGGYKGHLRAPGTVWWEYWGTHGSAGDSMVGVWGKHGGTGGYMVGVLGDAFAGLGTIWWEYWETHGDTGDNIVGVLGDAWRYCRQCGGSIGG